MQEIVSKLQILIIATHDLNTGSHTLQSRRHSEPRQSRCRYGDWRGPVRLSRFSSRREAACVISICCSICVRTAGVRALGSRADVLNGPSQQGPWGWKSRTSMGRVLGRSNRRRPRHYNEVRPTFEFNYLTPSSWREQQDQRPVRNGPGPCGTWGLRAPPVAHARPIGDKCSQRGTLAKRWSRLPPAPGLAKAVPDNDAYDEVSS
jgi:hypothetical protein